MKNLKILLILSLFSSFQVSFIFSQNLFDSLNTLRYADYLYGAARYAEAIEEYERYVFLFDASDNECLRMIHSYRKAGDPDKAYNRMLRIWDTPSHASQFISREYYGLKILTNRNDDFLDEISLNDNLSENDKAFLASTYLLLDLKVDQARNVLSGADHNSMIALNDLLKITEEISDFKFKSPFLSGLLSTIIPGSGKFYTGSVGDGIITMTMVGSMAWQAYRGFDKNGIESVYGWVFATIGAGFYIGNIWGSVKAANKYNYQQKDRIRIRVKTIFNHNL
jgi:TM2 domain-containing membrane protein YozV